jgi:hypothetical protein
LDPTIAVVEALLLLDPTIAVVEALLLLDPTIAVVEASICGLQQHASRVFPFLTGIPMNYVATLKAVLCSGHELCH